MPPVEGEFEELRFRRLLVAIDGSANAELALRAGVTVARRDRATLTLICVTPDVVAETSRWPWPAQVAPADQDEADHFAERILREAVARMPDDVSVTTVLKRGRPGPEIVAYAKADPTFDAILLGARGVGRVEAMLGSVSQFVMHHAEIAVFVAHAPRTAAGDAT